MRLVPRGTHEYARLVRPAELAGAARLAGLELLEVAGVELPEQLVDVEAPEYVLLGVHPAEALSSVSIVLLPLLRVAEHRISLVYLLELCIVTRFLVWMILVR